MTIADELKPQTFENHHQMALVNILFTGNWISNRINHLLKDIDITHEQFNILKTLKAIHPEPANISCIQSRMIEKNSNASRLVEKLRLKSYVVRIECPNDRRQQHVLLTDSGMEILENSEFRLKEFFDVLKTLPCEDISKLNTLLDQLRQV